MNYIPLGFEINVIFENVCKALSTVSCTYKVTQYMLALIIFNDVGDFWKVDRELKARRHHTSNIIVILLYVEAGGA